MLVIRQRKGRESLASADAEMPAIETRSSSSGQTGFAVNPN
jgi:hypothetical protein